MEKQGGQESLNLCLACKGCQSDCPMHVDMATYKAEFLSHYYEGRLRPRHAYSMGLIHIWARIASKMRPAGQFCRPRAGNQKCDQMAWRHFAKKKNAAVCAANISRVVVLRATTSQGIKLPARWFCGWIRSIIIFIRRFCRRRFWFWKRPGTKLFCRSKNCVAGARFMILECSTTPKKMLADILLSLRARNSCGHKSCRIGTELRFRLSRRIETAFSPRRRRATAFKKRDDDQRISRRAFAV